jgi:hypothetical protein
VTSGNQLALRPENRPAPARGAAGRDIALIDLLDRLLEGGVTIHGQIMLSVAGIDLVEVDLRVLVAAVDKVAGR